MKPHITIPSDLKPGEIVVCNHGERLPVVKYTENGNLETRPATDNRYIWFVPNGGSVARDDRWIVAIERIASAKPKKAKPSAVDRLIEVGRRCVPLVNPKAFAGELAKTRPMKACYLNDMLRRAVNAARRERAIARRLGGGK